MWVWLFVGVLIGGAMGAVTMCLVQDKRLENFDLRLKCADLRVELEDERYRHDRVQDFCVRLGDQLDAAKEKLRWVPVTERLPHKEEYTAKSEDGAEYYVRLLIAYKTDVVEYEIGYYDGYKWMTEMPIRIIRDVVAWMPFHDLSKAAREGIATSPREGAPRNDSVLSEAGADG